MIVADGGREKPDAHHQTDDASRRELRHRAQPDRAQTQLAERVHRYVAVSHIGLTSVAAAGSSRRPAPESQSRCRPR